MFSHLRALPHLLLAMLTLALIGAPARANIYTVDRGGDANDGACSTSTGGNCNLRAAVVAANSNAGADTIVFAPDFGGDIPLATTQLNVTDDLTIQGPGAQVLSVSGKQDARIFEFEAGHRYAVSGLTLKNGAPTPVQGGKAGSFSYGGAIQNFGDLTVSECLFTNNRANFGAAIRSVNAKLTVSACAFVGNNPSVVGSQNITSHGDAGAGNSTIVRNSTFFNNGRAVVNQGGALQVRNCTITGNQIGIWLQDNSFGQETKTTQVDNCIVVGNRVVIDLSGNTRAADVENNDGFSGARFASGGYNLVGGGDATGDFGASGDVTGVGDAGLTAFGDNGGPTPTFKLDIESPALDAGNSNLSTDGRGRPRPVDVPGVNNAANASDIGAVENEIAQGGSTLVVNTPDDHDDDVCSADDCTLREAMNQLYRPNPAQTIAFDASVFGGARQTITANTGDLPFVDTRLTMSAPPVGLVIRGGGGARLFRVLTAGVLTLNNFTLTGGNAGAVTSGNEVSGRGGAIFNQGQVVLNGCTLSDNQAQRGGALYQMGDLETRSMTLNNCTLAGNSASEEGGGLYVFGGAALLNSVTVTDNVASYGLGVRCWGGDASARVVVNNSIIAGNRGTTGGDVDLRGGGNPNFDSQGHNLVGGGNAIYLFTDSGDEKGVTGPKLADLADNGGPTPTVALLDDSPALDTGLSTLPTDQRGVTRPQNGQDKGAFERVTALAVAVFLTPKAPITNDALRATASASNPGGGALTYAYVWKNNGVTIPGETEATLQLGKADNGDKGDVVSVQVTATSTSGAQGTGTAQVTVINSAPVTFSGVVNAEAGVETAFAFRGADLDGDPLTYERAGGPVNGTAVIKRDTDGVLKLFYTSRARYGGTDLIKFVARDSDGRTSNVATLSINVNYVAPPPANRPPVAGDTSIDTFTGKSEVKNLLGSDPDGGLLTFRIVRNAQYGSSEIKQDTDGKFKLFYTGLGKYFGSDSVTYVAVDDKNRTSNVATVSIRFINRAPNATATSLTVASGGAASKFLFGSDPDQNDISFKQVNGAKHGTSEVKLDGEGKPRVFYQSFAGYVGPDTVTFVTVDSFGRTSAVATVSVTAVKVGASSSAGGGSGGGS